MIEMDKKYQTRDGRAVRILAIDFKAGATCIIGAITMTDTNEIVGLWNVRGEEFGGFDHLDDLIPVPTKHHGYIIISKDAAPAILGNVVWGMHQAAESRRLGTTCPEAWIVVPVDWET